MAMVDIVKKIEKAFVGAPFNSGYASILSEPSPTTAKLQPSSAASSLLSSPPSSPRWPTPSQFFKRKSGKLKPEAIEDLTPTKLGRSFLKPSPYFPSPSKVRREVVSCIPFPPLPATSFGLVQESLAANPFHLLIALCLSYTFIARFPEPSSLAAAEHEEVVGFFQNLGLQNQRPKKCVALAKAWLEHPPAKGKRWRRLHYPNLGDGKDIKGNEEPIADETEDARVAWEVGHLPGIGAYGIDSWRIFCRDELHGIGTAALPGLPADGDEESRKKVEEMEMKREWTRVLPMDKELRAYL
ncbi:MAG: hypothetical protein Q9181_006355 [Wetmoreana brouardii]